MKKRLRRTTMQVCFSGLLGSPWGSPGSGWDGSIRVVLYFDDLEAFLAYHAGGCPYVPPELLDRGRGLGLVPVPCVAGEKDDPATCFAFLICSRRSGKANLLGLR